MVSQSRQHMIAVYIFAIVVAIWILVPVYWMVNTSLQTEVAVHELPVKYVATNPTLDNYWFMTHVEEAMKARLEAGVSFFLPAIAKDLPQSMVNSIAVAVAIVIINLILGSHLAYTLSRIRFRGSYPIFLISICSRLLPEVAVIVPFYLIIKSIGLINTTYALVMIYITITLPFSVWILYNYFSFIPEDIEESARIDGYSRFEVLYKVVMPVIRPGLVAIGIMSFMVAYREFFFAFILTSSVKGFTVPVIIGSMAANPVMPISLLATAGVIAMIPPIVMIIIFRRYIVRGLVSGAVR